MRGSVVLLMLLTACRYGFERTATGDGGGDDDGAQTSDVLADAPRDVNLVFLTQQTYSPAALRAMGNGDFVAGADATCHSAATAQGLPGTYVALVSAGTLNARDRLAGSRGWFRLDGLPFADTAASMFAGEVYYPVLYDETRTAQPTVQALTGTAPDGTTNRDCSGWTSDLATDQMYVGNSTDGSFGWSSRYVPGCDSALHLYCFGIGHDTPLTITPVSGKRAFVTINAFSSGAGRAAADTLCQSEADNQTLGGQWWALLGINGEPPDVRFVNAGLATGPSWVRLDGIPLAASASDFMMGRLLTALTTRPDGTHYGALVWSGTTGISTIVSPGKTCSSWSNTNMSSTAFQAVASSGPNTFFWENYEGTCNTSFPVMCLER